jgi:hypothetical protein
MGNCLACTHELDRHLFGGMCFYCDCKSAVMDTSGLVLLRTRDANEKPSANGTRRRKKSGTPRLGKA